MVDLGLIAASTAGAALARYLTRRTVTLPAGIPTRDLRGMLTTTNAQNAAQAAYSAMRPTQGLADNSDPFAPVAARSTNALREDARRARFNQVIGTPAGRAAIFGASDTRTAGGTDPTAGTGYSETLRPYQNVSRRFGAMGG
jgi:hypothetical protein